MWWAKIGYASTLYAASTKVQFPETITDDPVELFWTA